eukprot:scaffold5097_cov52-Attheya_sp.AAC.13
MKKSVSSPLSLLILIASSVLCVSKSNTAAAFSPSRSSSSSSSSGIVHSAKLTRTRIRRPDTTSIKAQIFVDLVNEYQYLTATFPLPTQSATFGTFAGVGDALAQKTEQIKASEEEDEAFVGVANESNENYSNDIEETAYDGKRTQRFVLKGLGAGLIWSQWYPLVDGWTDMASAFVLSDYLAIEDAGTAHTIAKTVLSILMEQFIACPIVYTLWDIPVPALLAGVEPSKIPGMVKEKVPGLLLDNAKVWTVANVVVYNLPVQWRIFAVSVCEIFWASIVSSVATEGMSSVAFIEAQDALITTDMADEKREQK